MQGIVVVLKILRIVGYCYMPAKYDRKDNLIILYFYDTQIFSQYPQQILDYNIG